MKNKDLELLLSELKNKKPNDLQVKKWKLAVNNELKNSRKTQQSYWPQIIAASFVGFIAGAIAFGALNLSDSDNIAKNDVDNATVEYVFTKSN